MLQCLYMVYIDITRQYPLEINTKKATEFGRLTRGISNKNFIEPKALCSFIGGDATRFWNKAPENVRNAKSIGIAKKVIQIHCETLPI